MLMKKPDLECSIMYTNKTAALLTALLTFVAVNSVLGEHDPDAKIVLQKWHFVVGEPIVMDFVVRNESAQPIQTRAVDDVGFSRLELVVRAFAERQEVAEWCGGSPYVLDLHQMRNPDTGEWLFQLAPGEALSARKLVVLILPPPKDPWQEPRVKRGPLFPGRYVLVGSIPWVDGRIETEAIEVDIVASDNQDDRQAAELVDPVFDSFMGDSRGMVGISGMDPTGSVARILNEYPDSIHAELARSRLVQLRAHRIMDSYPAGMTPEQRSAWPDRQSSMVKEIDEHLRRKPDDPLKLDLLYARMKILRKLELADPLDKACDEMIAAAPNSTYAQEARELKEEVRRHREEAQRAVAEKEHEE
jgi:hypothetical protein